MAIQKWQKLGKLFPKTDGYAAVPFVGIIENDIAQIFYSTRDVNGKSELCSVNLNLNTLSVVGIPKEGILKYGKPGTFDEDGVMACDMFDINNVKYITYIGWNRSVGVPFRNAIGLAKFENEKVTKCFEGPILDRSIYDPCFVASNCVLKVNNIYIMYYLSCKKWDFINSKLTHFYNIKIATSNNGFTWNQTGDIAIDFKYNNEYAISVPRVIIEGNIFKMWYSYRGSPESETYRIGYAESLDGFKWIRKDEEINFKPSIKGWDSEMLCYPYIFNFKENTYMLYNGNGYGKTGFGIAILEK